MVRSDGRRRFGRTPLRRYVALFIVLFAVVFGSSTASAHPNDATLLTLRPTVSGLDFKMLIPVPELERSGNYGLADDPATGVAANRDALVTLVEDSLTFSSADGQQWVVHVASVRPGSINDVDQVEIAGRAVRPAGSDADYAINVTDTIVVDTVTNHEIYVAIDSGGESPDLVGTITARHTTLAVELGNPSRVSFGEMVREGIKHFRSGTDHLMFLTLITATAVFERTTLKRRLTELALLTIMFTIGHSVSLMLAATGVLTVPSRIVETGIAATIVLGAVHLIHPVLPRRYEPLFTLLFGFIHGFGFAGTLSGLGLQGSALILPTLGFNVGLELAQLGAALVLLPGLWLLARERWARVVLGVTTGLVAAGWFLNRAAGAGLPVDQLANTVALTPERLALTLLVLGGVLTGARHVAARSRSTATRDV